MILLSNGGTNIQRAQSPSDTILVGTVDGVALLGKIRARLGRQASRAAGRVRQRRHRARRRHAVRLDARRRHGAKRRRRHQMDLGQRRPGAPRILVVPRRQIAGPRRGVRRRAAGASLCQRGQGQILARAQGVPRRQDGQALDLPAAAAHRPYQGHRARRRPAVGRRRDRLAAGLEGLRPELHRAGGRSRSAGVRHPSHSGASGAAQSHHHRQWHRRHDVERGWRRDLAEDEDARPRRTTRTPSSSIPTSPISSSCRPASAGRCTGTSSAAPAARFSGAAMPARPGSGCSAACRTASARCSAA